MRPENDTEKGECSAMITTNTLRRLLLALLLLPLAVQFGAAQAATALRLISTSYAGTTVTIIDPATNKVVGRIPNIEVSRSAAVSPDGSQIYVVGLADRELVVVDAKTLQITKRLKVGGRPDYTSTSPDGRHVYVGLGSPNVVDVYDTTSWQKVKSIPVEGSIHYAYVTPDGKYIVTASVGGRTSHVINTKTLEQEWMWKFDRGVRPICFETNPDGSTKNLYIELTDLHGFAVVDFVTRKEITRITLPDIPGKVKNLEGVQGAPAHGIEISPDGKQLWVASKWWGYVFAYSIPDLKLIGQVEVGALPEWISFAPDGKRMYVSVAGEDKMAVVDPAQKKLLMTIPVGYAPKFALMTKLQVK